ncbi:dynamin-A-like [Schistocerca gregaria]|uniref:dynamin-A-like n=1 Tax=Schistocerca gregaria TaxID=7010 RepID=UPI00211E6BF6|nr:dynamin-A-like [Schistocerca gregaria]
MFLKALPSQSISGFSPYFVSTKKFFLASRLVDKCRLRSNTSAFRFSRLFCTQSYLTSSDFVQTVSKLQEIFVLAGVELALPQIVVVGSQSSGKSSVLENLVGRDFFPRGAGIVTRCPLILQLNKTACPQEEWGEFLHQPGTKYFQFDLIKQEILEETVRRAGGGSGIVDKPILLKIFSPKVIDLTLVDLPGIARNPVGDQPRDIESRITNMIQSYASHSNSIILAVHAANQDIATSDAIKLAAQSDPKHTRTIGVLTKLDLMDRGTDAMDLLLGKQMPLLHGWIPIVSRSQADIDQGKTIQESLIDEVAWFRNHPIYSLIANKAGTRYLAVTCNRLLSEHIERSLPDLRNNISTKIRQLKAELKVYGEPLFSNPSTYGPYLLSLVNSFCQAYKDNVDGVNRELQIDQLNSGARIRYILNENFAQALQSVKPLTSLSISDVRMAILNLTGLRPALMVSEQAFEQLSKKQIELFRDPALQAAEMVYSELVRAVKCTEVQEISRFPRLVSRIHEMALKTLRRDFKEAVEAIHKFIDLELGYIDTSHPDFVKQRMHHQESVQEQHDGYVADSLSCSESQEKSKNGLASQFWSILFGPSEQSSRPKSELKSSPPESDSALGGLRSLGANVRIEDMSEQEMAQVRMIVQFLRIYLGISRKSIRNAVVKIIMVNMVNRSKESIQHDLVDALYRPELFGELLVESPEIEEKREAAREALARFKAANKVVRSYNEGI